MALIPRLLMLLAFSLLALVTHAETYVFVTNSTDKPVSLRTVQGGYKALTRGTHWNQEVTEIPAYATRRVLWFNRNEGITNGKNFTFDTYVSAPDGSQVVLQQYLTGTWTSSKLWHSGKSADFNAPWYSDRDIHRHGAGFDAQASTFGLKAEFTGGYDDLYYVIQPNPVAETVGQNPDELKVVAYNIWGVIGASSISDRFVRVPQYVRGNDVVIFSEAFDNSARAQLTERMRADYPYYSAVVDSPWAIEDGGVMIFSRWPIVREQQIVYDRCNGSDCLSAKGAMYVELIKNGKAYHVLGTHTQAWNEGANRETRLYQLGRMRALADSMGIPGFEPVLFGGDLNVDKLLFATSDYPAMLSVLNVSTPSYRGYGYTYDSTVNANGSDGREYLDYVFAARDHRPAVLQDNAVRIYRTTDDPLWRKWDLSDHFAVQGLFQF